MRIVSGKHRGRRFKSLKGRNVRPTSDRVKEAIFNMLADRIDGSRVLDLFAGIGNLSLEALSRGATHVTCVDNSSAAVKVMRFNFASIGEEERVHIVRADVEHVLGRGNYIAKPFDLVFVDPPYKSEMDASILPALHSGSFLTAEAVIIYETAADYDFAAFHEHFSILKSRTYGNTKISLILYNKA